MIRLATLVLLILSAVQPSDIKPRTVELRGNATVGFYCVTMYAGSRMQPQCLIIDTGSSITTFPCKGCSFYGDKHYDPIFDPEKSEYHDSTLKRIQDFNWTCRNQQPEGKCPFSIVRSS